MTSGVALFLIILASPIDGNTAEFIDLRNLQSFRRILQLVLSSQTGIYSSRRMVGRALMKTSATILGTLCLILQS